MCGARLGGGANEPVETFVEVPEDGEFRPAMQIGEYGEHHGHSEEHVIGGDDEQRTTFLPR